MSRADVTLARLLALLPWLRAHPGVTFVEVCEKFEITADELRRDLAMLTFSGHGRYGGELIDIDYYDKTSIRVIDAQTLDRPLQLSVAEGVALLGGLRLLAQLPGAFDHSVVASVAAKIEDATAASAGHARAVDVVVESSSLDVGNVVRAGIEAGHALTIEYISGSDDARTTRTVDPMGVLVADGRDYLQAWCRRAAGVRNFRFDRIVSVIDTGEAAVVPTEAKPVKPAGLIPDGPVATLLVDAAGRWIVDSVPVQNVTERDDGGAQVDLSMANRTWLVRQVLRLSGHAQVLAPEGVADLVLEQARTALAAYEA